MSTGTALLIVASALVVIVLALVPFAYQFMHSSYSRRVGNLILKPKKFVTGNELEFFHRLSKACKDDYRVMTQVSMGALVETDLNPEHPKYWEMRSLYSGRICDYVLCHPKTLAPVLVIELDDKMHDFNRDRKRDTFLAQAGIPSLRVWSRNKPDVDMLRAKILQKAPLKSV